MIFQVRKCVKDSCLFHLPPPPSLFLRASRGDCSRALSSLSLASPSEPPPRFIRNEIIQREGQTLDTIRLSDLDILIANARAGSSEHEILQSLSHDEACKSIQPSHGVVSRLLGRFKDDWKSALGVFRWAESRPDFTHPPEAYDMMVDILGKMKQMEKMRALVEEMRANHLVTLGTISKVMRRLTGAGQWEEAVSVYNDLGAFGLDKNTEAMNLLLDALCKANKVEQAREIFLDLKTHVSPNPHTFNIFIHGWCKVDRVDEAHWTIEEMKGHGCSPCVISYSTIIQSYCRHYNFSKVYGMLDEMHAQGCPANVVTYTTVMFALAKSGEFEEALQLAGRMKSTGCAPDALYYNCLIHTLGKAGRMQDAFHVFRAEMPETGISPTTSTYNSLIAMLCHHGQECKALAVLKEMEDSAVCRPDAQTYYPLLKSCIQWGRVDDCLSELLDDMVSKHHLSIDLSTYALLIHGLCKANKCKWAYFLFEEMIAQGIRPAYHTCHLLLDELKQANMYEAAGTVEALMREVKATC